MEASFWKRWNFICKCKYEMEQRGSDNNLDRWYCSQWFPQSGVSSNTSFKYSAIYARIKTIPRNYRAR